MTKKKSRAPRIKKKRRADQKGTPVVSSAQNELLAKQDRLRVVEGLPGHVTTRPLRQANILHMQHQHGNRSVQQLLTTVQRQNHNEPRDATLPGGVPAAPALATFTQPEFSKEFSRFDTVYEPVGPVPDVGTLTINLWVHINFTDFSQAMMQKEPFKSHQFTPAQMADFAWSQDEKNRFELDFMTSVMGAWSGKHMLKLQEPGFANYRGHVQVVVISVDDPSLAHTKITAQKVPKDAPRLRSKVEGDQATMDIRDPSEPETKSNNEADYVRQIGPFGFDKAKITPALKEQLEDVKKDILPMLPANHNPDDLNLILTGRASSEGRAAYNEDLASRRARAVAKYLEPDLGMALSILEGEENATTEEKFRRVDISYIKPSRKNKPLAQNVAAHEAGHMFGLGDEYVEEKPDDPDLLPKFLADKPTHHGAVETVLGTETADDLLVQNSSSIMSSGNEVKRGHYVSFVVAINRLTGKDWTLE